MENQNATSNQNQNQQQPANINLKISAVTGLPEQEESATIWLGRQSKNSREARRDLQLSQPLPTISKEDALELAIALPDQIANLLNEEAASYIRRVKAQRLTIGDTLELSLPAGGLPLATLYLTMLTEGTREKAAFSAAHVRDLIASEVFKTAVASYCKQAAIAPEAFKRVVIDEFLKASTRTELSFSEGRAGVASKAANHLEAISNQLPAGEPATPQLQATLRTAVSRIRGAQFLSDDDLI